MHSLVSGQIWNEVRKVMRVKGKNQGIATEFLMVIFQRLLDPNMSFCQANLTFFFLLEISFVLCT